MPRTLIESPITTRSARAALKPGVHWRGIDPDVHLGYRKGRRGGRWLVRWYAGERRYCQATLGTADDVISEGNLSFEAASKAARSRVVAAREAASRVADEAPVTVRMAVETYVAMRDRRASLHAGRTVRSDAHSRLTRTVLNDPALADLELGALTDEKLSEWRARVGRGLKATSAQRTASDLKAALNAAYAAHRKRLSAEVAETIRFAFKASRDETPAQPVARSNQILADGQVRRLVEHAFRLDRDGDFAILVAVLAATGARFSQVARMRIEDVQPAQRRLLIPTSRKGQKRVAGHVKVCVGADLIEALVPIMEGRGYDEVLLQRWRYRQTDRISWVRDRRGPWTSASEMTRPWKQLAASAGLPHCIPYALRHSSIVRGLRAGLPVRLVAALHDTSVEMIERHYSRWITDGLEELAARAVIPLISSDDQRSRMLVAC